MTQITFENMLAWKENIYLGKKWLADICTVSKKKKEILIIKYEK